MALNNYTRIYNDDSNRVRLIYDKLNIKNRLLLNDSDTHIIRVIVFLSTEYTIEYICFRNIIDKYIKFLYSDNDIYGMDVKIYYKNGTTQILYGIKDIKKAYVLY
jgi:hypothetical protein